MERLLNFDFRALEFVYLFLETVSKGEKDLVVCATVAYDGSLRQYHGWLVRGIFAVRQEYISTVL